MDNDLTTEELDAIDTKAVDVLNAHPQLVRPVAFVECEHIRTLVRMARRGMEHDADPQYDCKGGCW